MKNDKRSVNRWMLPFFLGLTLLGCECEDPTVIGTAFNLCIAPNPVEFGDVNVRTGVTQTVVVENCGSNIIEVLQTKVVATDETQEEAFKAQATEVQSPFGPGEQFLLPVRFFARAPGSYVATLVFELPNESTTSLAEVVLRAEAQALDICDPVISPETLDVGAVIVGQSGRADFTIANQGLSPCSLSGARVTAGQDAFDAVSIDTQSAAGPFVLSPGASTTARVEFVPTEIGPQNGTFSIIAGSDNELTAGLEGNALQSDACVLSLEPTTVVFPRAAVNFSSSTSTGMLKSIGELPCTISDASSTLADFDLTEAPQSGTLLNPGDEVAVAFTFTPLQPGPREGALLVTTDEGVEFTYPLVAFADPTPSCGLRFEPAPITFGGVAVGLQEEIDVTITNVSDLTCTITGASLNAVAAPDLSLVTLAETGDLLPGESVGARIRFAPQSAAPAIGTLEVQTQGDVGSRVDIIGFSDFAQLVLTPDFQFFGFVTEGCVSRTFPALLSNTGPVAARVDLLDFDTLTDPNFELLTPIAPNTVVQPGQSLALQMRMLAGPNPGSHAGALNVLSTGSRDRVASAELTGTTESVADAARTDVFRQRQTPEVDILFVIDNSGSMQQEQTNLAQNFSSFISFTNELAIDYHIGITTTDTNASGAGELVAPYIANTGAEASIDPLAEFVANVNVGTQGSGTERGLQAAALAVTEPNLSGANAGFLRDSALLSIIFVSDEEDSSPGDVGDYFDTLLEAKGYDTDAIIASAIGGDVPTGCSANGNSAQSGARYNEITNGLGGIYESICTADWATTMEELGLDTFSALTRFSLSRIPDPSTLVVVINDVVIPQDPLNGWTYDEGSNSIRLHGTSVPLAGDDVAVSYTAECLLP